MTQGGIRNVILNKYANSCSKFFFVLDNTFFKSKKLLDLYVKHTYNKNLKGLAGDYTGQLVGLKVISVEEYERDY